MSKSLQMRRSRESLECCLLFNSETIKHPKQQMGLGKALLQQEYRVAFCPELALFVHSKEKLWDSWMRQMTKGSLALKGLIIVIYASGHCDRDVNVACCAKPFMIETNSLYLPHNYVSSTHEVYIHKSMLF